MISEVRHVVDEADVAYQLGEPIAKGGQGIVYRVVAQPDLAIKLLFRPEALDHIARVRRLSLDGLHVAGPTTLLRGETPGYVMRLARDMTTLTAAYLPGQFGNGHDASWYRETGGLRRRLDVASRVAALIVALHDRALAYVDLNPYNVLISDNVELAETWLIDTDNLTSAYSATSQVMGMPGYLAPERSRPHSIAPPSTLADAYSLAVMVFKMLFLSHPLAGTASADLGAEEARDRADAGEFDYIGPSAGTSNSPAAPMTSALLPLGMTTRLAETARRTFGPGKLDPQLRPGAAAWRDDLFSALDNVVSCPGSCGWTMYRNSATCPACSTPVGRTLVASVHLDDGGVPSPDSQIHVLVVSLRHPTEINPRHLWGASEETDPILTITAHGDTLEVRAEGDAVVTDPRGRPARSVARPAGRATHLRLSVQGRPPRLLALRWAGPR